MTLQTCRQSIEKTDCPNSFSEVRSEPLTTRPNSNYLIVDDHPEGYPQLAAFVTADDNFLIARKYGFLRNRVLLYRQDELSVLERDLIDLDADDENNRAIALRSRKRDEETDTDPLYSRKVLTQKIDDKPKEYGQHPLLCYWMSMSSHPPPDGLVSRIKIYMSLKPPTSRNTNSFIEWIKQHKPLSSEESTFIQRKDDFVALSDDQESGWLDGIVEDGLGRCLPLKLMKVRHHFSLSIHLVARTAMNRGPDTQPIEDLYVRRAGQKNRSCQLASLQQTPHRYGCTPCSCPYHCCFTGGPVRRFVLRLRTECAENLSHYGFHAAFRRGAERLHEGEEA